MTTICRRSRLACALLGTAALWGIAFTSGPAHAFDCAKAYLGVDFAICSDPRLIASIDEMGRVWQRIKAATPPDQFEKLLADQRQWLKAYGPECGLPARGQPAPQQLAAAMPCVSARIDERLAFLAGLEKPIAPAAPPAGTASYAWTKGFAQGTFEAGVLNDADSRLYVTCPSGQLDTSPSISYSTTKAVETGTAESVAFTLIIDDTKERLYLRRYSSGSERTYSWTAANERQTTAMTDLVARIGSARYLAIEPAGSAMREEFSTRNASAVLKGILRGCEGQDYDVVQAPPPPPAAAKSPLPPAPSPVQVAAPAAFGGAHVSAIIEAAQTNEPRFQRDYKGKSFRSQVIFESLQDGFFGQKQLIGQAGGKSVQCFGRSDLSQAAIDWRVGQTVTISGTIEDTLLGSLIINPCTATK